MLRNLFKSKKDEGFTIIEVLIVLAIAGIILVIVLVAVPQLQRNQRNEARRNILARIATELNNYASNNSGQYPAPNTASGTTNFAVPSAADGFFNRYLGCTTAAAGSTPTCTANIDDPRHGIPVGHNTGAGTIMSVQAGTPGVIDPNQDRFGSIAYSLGFVCNGEVTAAGDGRNFAVQMRLEGGAIACIDNQ